MFTGLVEELGVVDDLVRSEDSARLRIRASHVLADAVRGSVIDVATLHDEDSGQTDVRLTLTPIKGDA